MRMHLKKEAVKSIRIHNPLININMIHKEINHVSSFFSFFL